MVPVPLFPGVPGGPELLILLLVLVIPFGVGIYVYRDAKAHGETDSIAALWALAVAFGIVLYLIRAWSPSQPTGGRTPANRSPDER